MGWGDNFYLIEKRASQQQNLGFFRLLVKNFLNLTQKDNFYDPGQIIQVRYKGKF